MRVIGSLPQATNTRWIESFGNGKIACRYNTLPIKIVGQSEFSSYAAYEGSKLYISNSNWQTVANIQNMRGSYHGWLAPHCLSLGDIVNVKVTLDGKVLEEKSFVATGQGQFFRYCSSGAIQDKSFKDSPSYLTLDSARNNHVQGLGETFEDSLLIEMQVVNPFTGNANYQYGFGFYYAENKH